MAESKKKAAEDAAAEERDDSGPDSGPELTTEERVELVRDAADPSSQESALRGDSPRGPDFRDSAPGGRRLRNTIGMPGGGNERDVAEVEDAAFNKPGERHYTEDDVKQAEAQHDQSKIQAAHIRNPKADLSELEDELTRHSDDDEPNDPGTGAGSSPRVNS